jgi:proteasome accessory factor A
MGTETEYAVSLQGGGRYDPVRLSFDVVNGAADRCSRGIRWDYRQEDPVNDARGTRLERAAARPEMLTDAPQLNITNVIAPNGGRIYVDHAHPEYASPETTDPFEAVQYDHAGDLIMQAAAQRAAAQTGTPIVLHRNNVDGKGSSWGTHENYMMARSVPFGQVARLMTLHFVTRQIYAGSGRVGLGETSDAPGYQLSQRADYIHARVGLQTTFERPIINTRDESHSTARNRRLHVIVGDANRMDVPQVLKLGTTSMLLWLLEHADEAGFDVDAFLDDLELADPVAAMHTVSHDLSLAAALPLANGGETTAWLIQLKMRQAVYQVAAMVEGTDANGEPAWPDRSTTSVMAMWGQALADVATIRHSDDDGRLALASEAGRVEWLLKWQLLEKLRRKIAAASGSAATGSAVAGSAATDGAATDGAVADAAASGGAASGGTMPSGWNDPRLKALDLRWAALDPKGSVFARLQPHTERVHSAGEIKHAAAEPPCDTRAWLRARLVRDFGDEVAAVSWSRLTVRDPAAAQSDESAEFYGNAGRMAAPDHHLFSLDISDPLAFGQARCEHGLNKAGHAIDLLKALAISVER